MNLHKSHVNGDISFVEMLKKYAFPLWKELMLLVVLASNYKFFYYGSAYFDFWVNGNNYRGIFRSR